MHLYTLRSLLIALALVAQTVAGGWRVAHATTMSPLSGVSVHCTQLRDAAGDARKDAAHHLCNTCSLCAGSASVPTVDVVIAFSTLGDVTRAEFPHVEVALARSQITQARFARGPPAAA
jgi:hypothetical protein